MSAFTFMVCSSCWPAGFEIKTMGGHGPCCVCGQPANCSGPITASQRNGLRTVIKAAYKRGRIVGFADGARLSK